MRRGNTWGAAAIGGAVDLARHGELCAHSKPGESAAAAVADALTAALAARHCSRAAALGSRPRTEHAQTSVAARCSGGQRSEQRRVPRAPQAWLCSRLCKLGRASSALRSRNPPFERGPPLHAAPAPHPTTGAPGMDVFDDLDDAVRSAESMSRSQRLKRRTGSATLPSLAAVTDSGPTKVSPGRPTAAESNAVHAALVAGSCSHRWRGLLRQARRPPCFEPHCAASRGAVGGQAVRTGAQAASYRRCTSPFRGVGGGAALAPLLRRLLDRPSDRGGAAI